MPANVGGRYKGTAQERSSKRQKDIEYLGALSKSVESRGKTKQVQSDGKSVSSSVAPAGPTQKPMGEDPRGIIYGLVNKTKIEENKQDRLSKKK